VDPQEAEANDKIIESILDPKNPENKNWAEHIRHRGHSFFMIIQAWVRHVRRVLYNEKAINWVDVPGYREILKALLEELKHRPIHYY